MNLKESFQYIVLFENCVFTKGASRSLLVDNQRSDVHFFDNEIYKIFNEKSRKLCIVDILKVYKEEEQNIILEYLSFMIENELAFLCSEDELDLFPKMSRKYESPELISNCIIDFNDEPNELIHYKRAIEELDLLGCENIEIRDFYGLSFNFLNELMTFFDDTILHRIELVLKCNGSVSEYQNFVISHERINSLLVHSCYNLNMKKIKNIDSDQNVQFCKEEINDNSHCGVISPNYFNLDLRHTTESLNFNTCLNKKISIDINGDIKNCPSLTTTYGNIKSHKLIEIALLPQFQAIWGTSKNKITECKICEFRNICTDCRAFLKDDTSFEKSKKCSYNPYLMTWES